MTIHGASKPPPSTNHEPTHTTTNPTKQPTDQLPNQAPEPIIELVHLINPPFWIYIYCSKRII